MKRVKTLLLNFGVLVTSVAGKSLHNDVVTYRIGDPHQAMMVTDCNHRCELTVTPPAAFISYDSELDVLSW